MRYSLIFLSFLCIEVSYCQQSLQSKFSCGLQLSSFSNIKSGHVSVDLVFSKSSHDLFLGPQYVLFFVNPPIGDPPTRWSSDAFGVELGYRYNFTTAIKPLVLFTQFSYSINTSKLWEFQLGPPFSKEKSVLNVENFGTIGVKFPINTKCFLSGSCGLSSFEGFFLIIESIQPCVFLNLYYSLK